MTIYLDLDGVCVNFEEGIKKATGITGIGYQDNPVAFWKKASEVEGFFRKLSPTVPHAVLEDYFKELETCAHYAGTEVQILTALPLPTGHLKTAAYDKTHWVHRFLFSDLVVNCVPNWRYKKIYAAPGNILIDDSLRNIEDWRTVDGAIGIHHTDFESSLRLVKKSLGFPS